MKTLLLLALLVQDEGIEKARKLLQEAADRLKAAPAVSFETESSQGEPGAATASKSSRVKYLVKAPDKMLTLAKTANDADWIQICDGKNLWSYDGSKKEFTKYPQFRGTLKSRSTDSPLVRLMLEKDPAVLLSKAKDVTVSQRKEGDETFDIVSWRGKDPWRRTENAEFVLWLDKSRTPRRFTRSWEWQDRLQVSTLEYLNVDLAPAVKDDAFVFTPPEGAAESRTHYGQSLPDTEEARAAQKILLEVHKAFSGSEAIFYEVESRHEISGELTMPAHLSRKTLRRPDFIREEIKSEHFDQATISDGVTSWEVHAHSRNYTQRELMTPFHRMYMYVDPFLHLFFEGERPEILGGGRTEIAVVQEELDGMKYDVIEWTQNGGSENSMRYRFWIGADRRPFRLAYKSEYKGKVSTMTQSFKSFDLKPEIPKDFFTFVPGPDWNDRSDEVLGDRMVPVGKIAPDFEAVDENGATVKLSSFKGPVVLVFGYFTMYYGENVRLKEFQDDFSKKGITVLAVTVLPKATAPDPKKFPVPWLKPKDPAVAKTFGQDFRAGGLYLLDGDRKVLAATYGNEDLKKAIEAMERADK
jgi:outer membrane lipoprotein-sorting protein/peroxiredoxin